MWRNSIKFLFLYHYSQQHKYTVQYNKYTSSGFTTITISWVLIGWHTIIEVDRTQNSQLIRATMTTIVWGRKNCLGEKRSHFLGMNEWSRPHLSTDSNTRACCSGFPIRDDWKLNDSFDKNRNEFPPQDVGVQLVEVRFHVCHVPERMLD